MSTRLRIDRLEFSTPVIPFKAAFRHASAERAETSSVLVTASSAGRVVGLGESCPRPYVTGETIDIARAFFDRHEASLRATVGDLPSLRGWMAAHAREIDANPAAFCALELALLDALARDAGVPVESLLGLPALSGRFMYTAVIGDSDAQTFAATLKTYRQAGFREFKVKLAGDLDRDRDKVVQLERLGADCRVRADANNLWPDAGRALAYLRALGRTWFAVEEPVRAGDYDQLARLADGLDTRVVLDESCLRAGQIASLPGAADRWIVNVRVSKMGGLLRSLGVIAAARARGVAVIVGAQVGETSLLTRAGLTAALAAGDALVAQEGAFGTWLLSRDVCDPPLMFGAGGVLDPAAHPRLRDPGLGVDA